MRSWRCCQLQTLLYDPVVWASSRSVFAATTMKRRNALDGKPRRPVKRINKISEGFYGSTLVYLKLLLLWALVLLADHFLEFRFEYLFPFWLFLRSVYDSFKYQGLAFSVFFICVALTSDMICFLFIPIHWLFFAASTYVWVQYVWHTDRGICIPTVFLWLLFVYIEASIRLKEFKAHIDFRNLPFHLDLCRPFAAHCIGYPVVTLSFGFKTYVGYRMRQRKQREVQKVNEYYYEFLREALPPGPIRDEAFNPHPSPGSCGDDRISNGTIPPMTNGGCGGGAGSTSSGVAAAAAAALTSSSAALLTSLSAASSSASSQASSASSTSSSSTSTALPWNGHHANPASMSSSNGSSSTSSWPSGSIEGTLCGCDSSPRSAKNNNNTHHRHLSCSPDKECGGPDQGSAGGSSGPFSNGIDSLPICSAAPAAAAASGGHHLHHGHHHKVANGSLISSSCNGGGSTHPDLGDFQDLAGSVASGSASTGAGGAASGASTAANVASVVENHHQNKFGSSSTPSPAGGVGGHQNQHHNQQQHSFKSGSGKSAGGGGSGQSGNGGGAARDTSRKGRDSNRILTKEEQLVKCEGDLKKLKVDLQISRNKENDLRDQIVSYMSSERTMKAEISNLQVEKSVLEARVSSLLSTRAGEKATLSSLERKLADERKQKAEFQIKLETERKTKKEAAHAEKAAQQNQTNSVVAKLEAEIKALKGEVSSSQVRCQSAEQEAYALRKDVEHIGDPKVLASRLEMVQEKNKQLEKSLSSETKMKMDLFAALGEAKRELSICNHELQKKGQEIGSLRQQIAEVLACMPNSSSAPGSAVVNGVLSGPSGLGPVGTPRNGGVSFSSPATSTTLSLDLPPATDLSSFTTTVGGRHLASAASAVSKLASGLASLDDHRQLLSGNDAVVNGSLFSASFSRANGSD